MSICYNFSFSFWCSLGFGEKFGLYFRVRRYENYWVVIILWKNYGIAQFVETQNFGDAKFCVSTPWGNPFIFGIG